MGNNLLERIFSSPSMVKRKGSSPWARTSGLKGKKRMCVFLGYVQMCEKNVVLEFDVNVQVRYFKINK
jgi:hypothetical protein